MLCMLESHHGHIYKIFKFNYASQLKSDREILSGWRLYQWCVD